MVICWIAWMCWLREFGVSVGIGVGFSNFKCIESKDGKESNYKQSWSENCL